MDGKTVAFTGRISDVFSQGGAVPAEFAACLAGFSSGTDSGAGAVLGTDAGSADGSNSRSAMPTKPADGFYYKVTATSGILPPIIQTLPDDATSFSFPLAAHRTWNISVEMKIGNVLSILDSDSTILSDSAELDLTENSLASHEFVLKPLSEGNGTISLGFSNPDSVFNSVTVSSVKKNGADATLDWNAAVNCSTSGLSMKTNKTLAVGVYDIKLDFKNGTKLVYTTMQTINVFPSLTTDKWVTSLAATDSDGKLKLRVTKQLTDAFQIKDFFVGATAQNITASDESGTGSPYKPLATVAQAVTLINDLPATNNENKPIQYTIHVKNGIEEDIASTIQIKNNISIECWKTKIGDTLGKATLKWTGDSATTTGNYMIDIVSGSLTIDGVKTGNNDNPAWSGLVIDGNKDNKAVKGITSDGEFHMKGGKIQNFKCGTDGDPVFLFKNKFVMDGGIISGNIAETNITVPELIYIDSCEFIMNDGIICDNDSTQSTYSTNPTIELNGSSSFVMNGGTITRNKAKCGGGIYVNDEASSFTMNNGKISNNEATSYGGGVYINKGSFNMKGGTIKQNTAVSGGGGVYVGYYDTSVFQISGSAYIPIGDSAGNKGKGKNDVSVSNENSGWKFYIGGALTPPLEANGITATITPSSYTTADLEKTVLQPAEGAEGVSPDVFTAACGKFKVTPDSGNSYKLDSNGKIVKIEVVTSSAAAESIATLTSDATFTISGELAESDISNLRTALETLKSSPTWDWEQGPYVSLDLSNATMTELSSSAFSWCACLKEVILPNGLTEIQSGAFWACDGMERIYIPSSVTSIDSSAFYACSANIDFAGNETLVRTGDAVYSADGKQLLFYCKRQEQDVIFTVPAAVEKICDSSFCDSKLKKVVFESDSTLTEIGENAFHACQQMDVFTIPKSVTVIGNDAFSYCCLKKLILPKSVTTIGNSAFVGWSTSLGTVYYEGSETDKAGINIGDGNDDFISSTWLYNCGEPVNSLSGLQAAISSAVDSGDVATITLDDSITLTEAFSGADDEHKITIDGGGQYRLSTETTSDNVVFENIDFQNGKIESDGEPGGMLMLVGDGTNSLIIRNCSFTNCATPNRHGDGQFGGSVYISGFKNITIENTTFYANEGEGNREAQAATSGGFIYIDGMDVEDAIINIKDCSFTGGCSSHGGALAILIENSATMTIDNCTFTNNYADWNGGVIDFSKGSIITIENSTFSGNYSNNCIGSNVFINVEDGDKEVVLSNCTIDGTLVNETRTEDF